MNKNLLNTFDKKHGEIRAYWKAKNLSLSKYLKGIAIERTRK